MEVCKEKQIHGVYMGTELHTMDIGKGQSLQKCIEVHYHYVKQALENISRLPLE